MERVNTLGVAVGGVKMEMALAVAKPFAYAQRRLLDAHGLLVILSLASVRVPRNAFESTLPGSTARAAWRGAAHWGESWDSVRGPRRALDQQPLRGGATQGRRSAPKGLVCIGTI
jgi:hypothetical protein